MQYGVTTVSPDESVNRVMNLMTLPKPYLPEEIAGTLWELVG
jgi:hypothetical protein